MPIARALGEAPSLRRDCEQGGTANGQATANRLSNDTLLICPFQGQAIINVQ